ncbi:MAG: 1-acyl-sn-glycerol-3-phosphate acyltransferase, partial [Chloroflexota bacterium]|nr:1-acyl-sn-glycerol-3-phosphate acyltransferase [Chloroflexota bacterium]
MDTVSWLGLRTAARLGIARRVRLRVEGLDHVPAAGPVLIASRHYHHLYDALALLTVVPRPLHFFVALDWVHGRWGRWVMEGACRAARWPVVLREEELIRQAREHPGRVAYRPDETSRYLRQGVAEATALLRAGRAVAIFPEAYPNVDPRFTPKQGAAFLPFRPGFARLAMM